ncbi:MAG: hypothetical protein MO846_09190 [Candidatus Devosia symbiotica]|nr:hypothetical protein [Candidatus Devosia symbiotica]
MLFPAFVDYLESRFGSFLSTPDYQSDFMAEQIAANGWAIWPPVYFSYGSVDGY